ncbi:hypothetical protein HK103_001676 [Boothiomyces macroporosus]|uniref:Uncharacterized protein n=1 Tax=Boothiomyces macroporosus TaxID=261099 RepID=A0AAD5UDV2_9FUNG|nr:hypothetical protein HK103_001676 [Boothiomyces macroporosus]
MIRNDDVLFKNDCMIFGNFYLNTTSDDCSLLCRNSPVDSQCMAFYYEGPNCYLFNSKVENYNFLSRNGSTCGLVMSHNTDCILDANNYYCAPGTTIYNYNHSVSINGVGLNYSSTYYSGICFFSNTPDKLISNLDNIPCYKFCARDMCTAYITLGFGCYLYYATIPYLTLHQLPPPDPRYSWTLKAIQCGYLKFDYRFLPDRNLCFDDGRCSPLLSNRKTLPPKPSYDDISFTLTNYSKIYIHLVLVNSTADFIAGNQTVYHGDCALDGLPSKSFSSNYSTCIETCCSYFSYKSNSCSFYTKFHPTKSETSNCGFVYENSECYINDSVKCPTIDNYSTFTLNSLNFQMVQQNDVMYSNNCRFYSYPNTDNHFIKYFECSELCQSNSACYSFSWAPWGECFTYSYDMSLSIVVPNTNGWRCGYLISRNKCLVEGTNIKCMPLQPLLSPTISSMGTISAHPTTVASVFSSMSFNGSDTTALPNQMDLATSVPSNIASLDSSENTVQTVNGPTTSINQAATTIIENHSAKNTPINNKPQPSDPNSNEISAKLIAMVVGICSAVVLLSLAERELAPVNSNDSGQNVSSIIKRQRLLNSAINREYEDIYKQLQEIPQDQFQYVDEESIYLFTDSSGMELFIQLVNAFIFPNGKFRVDEDKCIEGTNFKAGQEIEIIKHIFNGYFVSNENNIYPVSIIPANKIPTLILVIFLDEHLINLDEMIINYAIEHFGDKIMMHIVSDIQSFDPENYIRDGIFKSISDSKKILIKGEQELVGVVSLYLDAITDKIWTYFDKTVVTNNFSLEECIASYNPFE